MDVNSTKNILINTNILNCFIASRLPVYFLVYPSLPPSFFFPIPPTTCCSVLPRICIYIKGGINRQYIPGVKVSICLIKTRGHVLI
jgi:hypothetical protein